MVSSYWGHSPWGDTRIFDPESKICPKNAFVASQYAHKFLRELIEHRKRTGASKPFVIVTKQGEDKCFMKYKEGIHCDIFFSDWNYGAGSIYDPYHINQLVEVLWDFRDQISSISPTEIFGMR